MKLINKVKKQVRKSSKFLSFYMAIGSMLLNMVTPFLLSYSYVAYAEDIGALVSEEVAVEEGNAEEPSSEEESAEEPAVEEAVAEEPASEEPQASDEVVEVAPEENPIVEEVIEEAPVVENPVEENPAEEGVIAPSGSEPEGDILPDGASDYRPEEEVIEPVTDTTDVSDPVVEVIEETTEVFEQECLADGQEILDTTNDNWNIDEEKGIAETKDKVKLGVKYIFPEDEKVSVTFSCLPKNEEDRSTLRIERVKVADLNLPDEVNTSAEFAYDITTEMENETFEYEVTLPKPEGVEAKVSYIEKSLEEATKDDINLDEVKEVETEDIDQEVDKDEVKVSDLNHFTIFIVSSKVKISGMVSGSSQVTVSPGQSITVSMQVQLSGGEPNDWLSSRYRIGDGDRICVDTADHTSAGTYTETFDITAPATVGTYDLTLRAYNQSGCPSGGDRDEITLNDAIIVTNSPPLATPTLPNNPSDDYALNSVTGVWTNTSGGSNVNGLNTNEVRWGNSTGYGQSGLRFDGSGVQTFNQGNNFYLGMLTHMNWPITNAANGATLKITLSFSKPGVTPDPEFTFDFDIDETPNSGTCPAWHTPGHPKCDDKVTFPSIYGEESFTIGDKLYTLKINGFVNAYPSGTPISEFITEEQKNNSAFLIGSLSSVLVEAPQISLVQKAVNGDDADLATGPEINVGDPVNFTYSVQNTGNVELTNISVIDDQGVSVTCPKITLASGESMTCTGSSVAVVGQYTNSAYAQGDHGGQTYTSGNEVANYIGIAASIGSLQVGKEVDSNNDGIYEGADPPAFDLGFRWSYNGDATERVMGTQADLPYNTYSVTEKPVDGYHFVGWYSKLNKDTHSCANPEGNELSYPVSVTVDEVEGKNAIILCNARDTGSISGTKWHDLNGDGIWDNGEPGYDGFEICIDQNDSSFTDYCNPGEPSVLSGQGDWADGYYEFKDLVPGTYRVCEEHPAPTWVQTYPSYWGCHDVVVTAGQESSGNNFGNSQYTNITGWKWSDLDGDGIWDDGESAIKLGDLRYKVWTEIAPDMYSDVGNGFFYANGSFEFPTLPGTYWLSEYQIPDGWMQTHPGESAPTTQFGDRLIGPFVVTSGTVVTDANFGNVEYGSITGAKWEDLDGNGEWNGNEIKSSGWEIQLKKDNQVIQTDITDTQGFEFLNVAPGTYQVCEVSQLGWAQNYPGGDSCHSLVNVIAGEETNDIFFGNMRTVSCGDGIVNGQEDCDYGSLNGQSSCTSVCTWDSTCRDEMAANGNFDTPIVTDSNKWDIYSNSEVPGWTAEWYGGSGGDNEPQIEIHAGVNGWNPSGDQYVELDSDWDGPGGSLNGEAASISLYQNIPTVPGYEYKLTFKYSPRPNHSNNHLEAEVNSNVILDTGVISGGASIIWQTKEYTFTADSDTATIRFTELGNPDSYGMFLDGVSIECLGSPTNTVTVCKQDQNGKPLSGWKVGIAQPIGFDQLIPVTDGSGVNAFTDSGAFVVFTSGTYRYGNSSMIADAGFSYRPLGIPYGNDSWVSGEDLLIVPGALELKVNGENINHWGAYNSSHQYSAYVPGFGGGNLNLAIWDDHYGDNVNNGDFRARVSKAFTSGLTGDNGCITFTDVPYGDYEVFEVMTQNDWSYQSTTVGNDIITNYPATVTVGKTVPKITLNNYFVYKYCGDGIKNNDEQCDGEDGVTPKQNFCTPSCELIPLYDGNHSCSDNTRPVYVNTYTISSTDADGVNVPLTLGTEYLFKAIGSYNYDNSVRVKFADAAYGTSDDWSSTRSDIGIWGTNRGVVTLLANLGNGVGVVEWDDDQTFNRSHEYYKAYIPTTTNAQFLISDWYKDWYTTNTSCNNQGCMRDNAGDLTLEVYECKEPPVNIKAYKVVCTDESDLPNWGEGGPDVTDSTASEWVENHDSCSLVTDWKFQWSFDGVGNPGDNITEEAGTGWNTFEVQDGEDYALVQISDLQTNKLWFREVLQDGYIPFTYSSKPDNSDDVSAEFYCNNDVLNYDNWEWIDNPQFGQTYYCVAFNTPDRGNVEVYKFNDLNGNGIKDVDEPTLPDWDIVMDEQGGSGYTQKTDSDGKTIFDLDSGSYVLSEIIKSGWEQTAVTCIVNSAPEAGDIGLCHWNEGADRWNALAVSVTNPGHAGHINDYPYDGPVEANGHPSRTLGDQWCEDNDPRKLDLDLDSIERAFVQVMEGYPITINSGDEITCYIGNTQLSSIHGYKWDDVNNSGSKDLEELLLSGWTINLYKASGTGFESDPIRTMNTDSSDQHFGWYWFEDLLPGDYKVCEVLQDGWRQTFPINSDDNCHLVSLPSGNSNGFNLPDMPNAVPGPVYAFGNQQLGSINVTKYNDRNGNGTQDDGEEVLSDWLIRLLDVSSAVTDSNGLVNFNNLTPDTSYILGEEMKPGWYQTSITCEEEGEGVLITAPGEAYGHHGQCSGWNGCGNAATCAQWACEVNGYDNLESYGAEKTCPEFGDCNLFRSRGSVDMNWYNRPDCPVMGVTDIKCSNNSGSDSPLANRVLVQDIEVPENTKQVTVNPGDVINCSIGNRIVNPVLHITKENDTGGIGQQIGDLVRYKIIVWVTEFNLEDVKVRDLLPKGFKYVLGSWDAYNSDGDLGIPEPVYASPGTWNIGNLEVGKPVTLEYTAEIQSEVDAGLYKDLAWTAGSDMLSNDVIGLADPEGYVDTNFVGTQVLVDVRTEPDKAKADTEINEEVEEVLGASDERLPGTGISPFIIWAVLSFGALGGLLLILGGVSKLMKKRKGMISILAVLMFGLLSVGQVSAEAESALLKVRLEDPNTPVTENFNITFVVLDMFAGEGGRSINYECYNNTPANAAFSVFQDGVISTSGGDTVNCLVDENVLDDDGTYEFYVKVWVGSDEDTSDIESIAYDSKGPGKPKYIEKDKKSECKNEITLRTADDNGETSYVEVYREDDKEFTVGDGNRIETITLGSDEKYSFDDEFAGGDCGKKFYYAVRAFDSSGNASKVRSEEITETKTKTIEGETTEEVIQEAYEGESGQVLGTGEGTEGAEVVLEDKEGTEEGAEGSVLGEETEESTKGFGGGLSGFLKAVLAKWWLWLGLLAIIFIIANAIKRKQAGK